ncbi:Sporulation initiation phosphotransferase F [Sporomusa silvacetica DSM 10669]|uniref:Sporulation initiation phosphotransferase F n=1 Tax=Sporomusa silvacetica DSM 10669 TaxID=1123289 RepID=A0ABZ3IMV0_9FIRM|nr:response regulator [Sporomusa silvacetica]OZC18156.1 sporulation initiation phosphotransferase F [Sporomusa silvacetica DSM 10669]
MRILIAEDDMVSRKFLSKFLSQYGECDLTVDGLEALDAFLLSLKDNNPYDLVCLDIMMPRVDGVKVLKTIRQLERQNGVLPEEHAKVIMVTALGETNYVQQSFELGCDAYAAKPIDIDQLVKVMEKLGLVQQNI